MTTKTGTSVKEPRVNCRVTADIQRRIEKVAETNGIASSDVVRMAINRSLPQFESEQQIELGRPRKEGAAA